MPHDPVDIVEKQDDYAAHTWEMCLWPEWWNKCRPSVNLSWRIRKLDRKQKRHIPANAGIYTLLVQPRIANHPACSYLMYVGQAEDLQDRFQKYLTTERRIRPKVFRMLLKYEGHIFFCYAPVRKARLDDVEDHLLETFWPPCNTEFPGELRKVKGAFG